MKQSQTLHTPEEIWQFLFQRQVNHLQNKACKEYLSCLTTMQPVLNAHTVPDFDAINYWFKAYTGWEIVTVPGLIKDDLFFEMLSKKQFPSSKWLRKQEQIDYLEEPDMFHDIFGHVPLLVNKDYSDIMQLFGQIAVAQNFQENVIHSLQKLYWFTIEFGLIKEANELRIFGAGILSSYKEATWSLEDNQPQRLSFDLTAVCNQFVKTDEIQSVFYSINSIEELRINMLEYKNKLTYEMA